MKKILFFAAGIAIGYVLGARAGRERYDQLKDAAASITDRPEVKKVVEKAKETMKVAKDVAQSAKAKTNELVDSTLSR